MEKKVLMGKVNPEGYEAMLNLRSFLLKNEQCLR